MKRADNTLIKALSLHSKLISPSLPSLGSSCAHVRRGVRAGRGIQQNTAQEARSVPQQCATSQSDTDGSCLHFIWRRLQQQQQQRLQWQLQLQLELQLWLRHRTACIGLQHGQGMGECLGAWR